MSSDTKEITQAASADVHLDFAVQPCQTCVPMVQGVDCQNCGPCAEGEAHWNQWGPIPFQLYGPGDYVAPARTPGMPEYRIRVDDLLEFVYRLTREMSSQPYELNVGDTIVIESMTDETLNRGSVVTGQGIQILADGTITVRLLGQVRAAGRTVDELREELETRYQKYYKVPAITVTPLQVNAKLEDLRAAINGGVGFGGQRTRVQVTPEGSIQLPAIGSVPALGLTLDELAMEVNQRYQQVIDGVELTPALITRAPSYIYVVGEVATPGRFTIDKPTDVIQAIAFAGSWNIGANLRQVVVFRRTQDWRLMATKLDLRGAMLGKRPCPADNIMLRDLDIVVIPKNTAQLSSDFITLIFTNNIYRVLPVTANLNFAKTSTL
ncbi:MAG: polysaccharide biosynthesis/export family protein [Planctomycetales bacterium]|nr:polysaccharide biosynthesis/export family protein [Planctomycetales bacterium]